MIKNSKRLLLSRLIPLLSTLILVGCKSTPRAMPIEPPTALESAVQDADNDSLVELNAPIPIEWWTLFNDDQLSQFIQTGFQNSPSLKTAYSKILLAQSNADRVKSTLYPHLFYGGDVSRQKLSKTGLAFPHGSNTDPSTDSTSAGISPNLPVPNPADAPFQGGAVGIPVYFTQWETQFNLYYDFDIWKKNRNTLKAAVGEVYARIADEAFSRLQLSINIAQVYYQLQINYKRLEIAQAIVRNQTEYLKLNEQRTQENIGTLQLINSASYNLTAAKVGLLQIEGDIAVRENQLRTYLATNFEDSIDNIKIEMQPLPKVPVPQNLPLHLISHRPDIIVQLWLIESAGKQIEVAKAGFYPDFNLTALFGFQSLRLHELFQAKSSFFNVDPAFSLPLFDGGRLIANLNTSEINYDLAIYHYNDLILNATREVLDGLAILRNNEQQLQEFKNKLKYQEDLFQLTQDLVNNNLNSGLDYLSSEVSMLIAQDQKVVAVGNKIQALLLLIKALGGGYEETCYGECE